MKYSGRTTAHAHKFDDWKEKDISKVKDCIRTDIVILNAQWTTCPIEVEQDIQQIWINNLLGNDNCVYKIDSEDQKELEENYPTLFQYLKEQGLSDKEVWIHWWW